jgi:hypothetical protein
MGHEANKAGRAGATPQARGSCCSHQTILPWRIRLAPQRCAIWLTTSSPRPHSSSRPAWRSWGRAAELSSTSATSDPSSTSRRVTSPTAYRMALVTSSDTSSSVLGSSSSSFHRSSGSRIRWRAFAAAVSSGGRDQLTWLSAGIRLSRAIRIAMSSRY